MHRILGRFVIGAGALLVAATAHAQVTSGSASSTGRSFKLGGTLGATIPLGDFSGNADLGWHLGGLIEYKPSSVPVNLRGEITYHRSGLKSDYFEGFPNATGHASMINFVGNAIFPFGDAKSSTQPYAIAGLGLYHIMYSGDIPNSGGTSLNRSDTDLGLNLGGGFIFKLSGFETFVEARFHSVFTSGSNTNFLPISFGFRF